MALALRLSFLARMGCGNTGSNRGISVCRGRFISLTSFQQKKLIEFKLADIGEGIREVTMKEWFVKPGDKVSQFDSICEVQSDKASATITSRYDGIIRTLYYKLDDICLVGSTLVDIELQEEQDNIVLLKTEKSMIESNHKEDDKSQSEINSYYNETLTTPAVRKIAKENNVNLANVPASGKDGRILKEDIMIYLEKITNNIQTKEVTQTIIKNNSEELTKIFTSKKYFKHMWKSMTQSLTVPHFVYCDECDVSKLIKIRKQIKENFKNQGLSLSYMPFFIKAVSQALLEFPILNALINEKTESLNIKKEHNISIAMDTPDGLIVPNIKNVQNLNIVDITKELNRLQVFGKKSSISSSDLSGGTFSISNIGIIGGTYTKPIILSPQIVIGAFGQIKKLPRFDEQDNVIATNILTISWAADHRVVDGVTIAQFSNLWKHYIENPPRLLIGI